MDFAAHLQDAAVFYPRFYFATYTPDAIFVSFYTYTVCFVNFKPLVQFTDDVMHLHLRPGDVVLWLLFPVDCSIFEELSTFPDFLFFLKTLSVASSVTGTVQSPAAVYV